MPASSASRPTSFSFIVRRQNLFCEAGGERPRSKRCSPQSKNGAHRRSTGCSIALASTRSVGRPAKIWPVAIASTNHSLRQSSTLSPPGPILHMSSPLRKRHNKSERHLLQSWRCPASASSYEHTSELQSLTRTYFVAFCLSTPSYST